MDIPSCTDVVSYHEGVSTLGAQAVLKKKDTEEKKM